MMEKKLSYRDHLILTHNKNLLTFLRQLHAGEYLIPSFQRLFVWNPEHICGLWDSIFRHYPIGSILCWNTDIRLHVSRKIGGFYLPEAANADDGKQQAYILDGQQRATSLLISFIGGAGNVREKYSFDYTLYFDLIKAEFFFEKDYYKHKWDADAAFLLRINDIPDLPPDYADKLSKLSGFCPDVVRNLEQMHYAFFEYAIPLITLEGYDIEGVCAIFERINQTGMKLKNMDILIARGFKNYATVVEEDFPISKSTL
jgi:uncharacterized protein with ParB-like and HNH nuclease domain